MRGALPDRETCAYGGERSTVVRDAVIDRLKVGNRSGELRKGRHAVTERIATAIVDAPGERPWAAPRDRASVSG